MDGYLRGLGIRGCLLGLCRFGGGGRGWVEGGRGLERSGSHSHYYGKGLGRLGYHCQIGESSLSEDVLVGA